MTEKIFFQKAQPWIVCLVAALFFFYEFVQMSMFNAINPSLIHDFSISAAKLGSLSAAYFYANIIFMLPAGLILDRYSTKKIILIAMLICIIGTIGFGYTNQLSTAMFFRFLTGIGGSFPFLSCLRLALRWFPPRKMALVTGVIVTMAMLGGMIAQTPLTLMVEQFGWRNAVLFDGGLGIIFMFLIFLLVKNSPGKSIHPNYSEPQLSYTPVKLKQALGHILSNKQNWLFGLYTSMLNLPIFLLAQTWGSLYLIQSHHLSQTQASYLTSMIFLGTIIGSPAVGWFSDYVGRRKLPMYIGAFTSLGLMLLIMYCNNLNLTQMLILFFGLGFFTSTQIIGYPAISESNNLETTGGALGLASVLIMGGGALFEPFFGWLMELNWDGLHIDNAPVYSHGDYLLALMIMPAAFIIAIITTWLSRETFGKKTKK